MQIKKDNIRLEILRVGREMFLERGFADTSMRTIAKHAGVSLSNIYNYFSNKDELFREALKSAVAALRRMFEEEPTNDGAPLDVVNNTEMPQICSRLITQLILQYRLEFKTILFSAHGSSLSGIREELIALRIDSGMQNLRYLKERYPEINADISDFFVRTMSSWWFSIVRELVCHELSRSELEHFLLEYMEFSDAGWRRVLQLPQIQT